jgi:NADPH-dependent 2,4-dienoyl-CoA reductase/sulfur reductase-like enzyme
MQRPPPRCGAYWRADSGGGVIERIPDRNLAAARQRQQNVEGATMMTNWDKEADIVIIGAGTAGLVAAIQSRKPGDGVLVLEKEKEGVFRSSMSVIAGLLAFAGTKYQ